MKQLLATLIALLIVLSCHAQADELNNFADWLSRFIRYDQGQIDSLAKSAATTLRLQAALDNSFKRFLLHKGSNNLDQLKTSAVNNRTDYIIGNRNYLFSELRINRTDRNEENNRYYQIGFYGLYDYQRPDFASIAIQPFRVGGTDYVVYSYSLHGAGVYYVKEVQRNEIVFRGSSLSSGAPIAMLRRIDDRHLLVVEQMGDMGQRAAVIATAAKPWKMVPAFTGQSLQNDETGQVRKADTGPRSYLRFATNRTIISAYGPGVMQQYRIDFDASSKIIFYKRYNKSGAAAKEVRAVWINGAFKVDDYDIREDLEVPEIPR